MFLMIKRQSHNCAQHKQYCLYFRSRSCSMIMNLRWCSCDHCSARTSALDNVNGARRVHACLTKTLREASTHCNSPCWASWWSAKLTLQHQFTLGVLGELSSRVGVHPDYESHAFPNADGLSPQLWCVLPYLELSAAEESWDGSVVIFVVAATLRHAFTMVVGFRCQHRSPKSRVSPHSHTTLRTIQDPTRWTNIEQRWKNHACVRQESRINTGFWETLT